MAKKKNKGAGFSAQDFLLAHGEKFVFVILIAGAVMMVMKGSGIEKYTTTPDQIQSSAKKAEDHIKGSQVTLEEVDKDLKIYDYSDYARLMKAPINPSFYDTSIRWEQSLFPELIKRPDIIALPLEELHAEACIGAIQYRSADNAPTSMGDRIGGGGMNSAAGGGDIIGKDWICITGLIPVGKEFKEYDEKFSKAQYTDFNRDVPKYIYYDLERGTLDSNGKIQWEPVDLAKAYNEEVSQWNGVGDNPVSTIHSVPILSYAYPSLTMDCPPMVNKPFGEEVAHTPRIPLLSDEQLEEQTLLLKEEKDQVQEIKEQQKWSFDLSEVQSPFEAGFGGDGNRNVSGGRGMGPMGGEMGMRGGPNMGRGMSGMGMPNSPRGLGGNANRTSINRLQKVTKNLDEAYYLFRHFDFDVKPNVTYYYRVKLYLANPNFGLEMNLVENPSTVQKKVIETPFSEPSNPVALANNSRLLVETIKPGNNPWDDLNVTVSSIFFSKENAEESLAQGKKLARGQVANFREAHKPIELSGMGVNRGAMGNDGPRGMTPGNEGGSSTITKKEKRNTRQQDDHISNLCLVDALGGQNVKAGLYDLQTPSQTLFLDENGLIKIHKIRSDAKELERYSAADSNSMEAGSPPK